MEWIEPALFGGVAVIVVLYVRGVFIELSERFANLKTEVNQQIASRVLTSDFESERHRRAHDVDLIRNRVDDLENWRFALVRNDLDDEEDDDDDDEDDNEGVITAENAEVALDYDDVNITVGQ